jgi:hypothetical protein
MDNLGALKFSLVAKAPDWTVTVFRKDDKQYFQMTSKQLMESGLVSGYIVSWRDRYPPEMEKYHKSTINVYGLKGKRLSANNKIAFTYLPLSEALNADKEIENIFYGAYKLTTCGGVPIEVLGIRGKKHFLETVSAEGEKETYMETMKLTQTTAKPEDFLLPRGYKKAGSIREVISGAESRTLSKDVMDLFPEKNEPAAK